MRIKSIGFGLAGVFALVATGHAAPVNGTGNVTPTVIFGSGNANGSYTGQTANNIEVGLRAKQRFPPANVFNYNGIDTYTFDSTILNTNPTNRSVFNFEWSVNVDQSGTSGAKLNGFIHSLAFDTDASAGVSYTLIDPFNTFGYFDHSLGTNLTGNGAGFESANNADLLVQIANYNVAQQSSNLGFGFSADPDLPGLYSFRYQVFALGDTGLTNALSSSEILVRVLPVPTPATLPLAVAALGLVGFMSRRRKRAV